MNIKDHPVCHNGTLISIGRLADAELRRWKRRAHAAFDPLWKHGRFKYRNDAYAWLSKKMGIPQNDCHIGRFTVSECKLVVSLCQELKVKKEAHVKA